jgi:hypothetical protein
VALDYVRAGAFVSVVDQPTPEQQAILAEAMRVVSQATRAMIGRAVLVLPGRVHAVRTSVHITATPEALETCECGTGNDAIGPGHSDWCRRYHP